MKNGVFITGTDTGIGKTHVAIATVRGLAARGLTTAAMKPVACGCDLHPTEGWQHGDATSLRSTSNVALSYEDINPYPLIEPISPHLAARNMSIDIDLNLIYAKAKALAQQSDWLVVEGAGGIAVPLSDTTTQSDLIILLGLPVVLVVGIRLGCLNHAILSADYLRARKIPVLGWVANCPSADSAYRLENIDTLSTLLTIPLLGVAEYEPEGGDEHLSAQLAKELLNNPLP